MTQNPRAAAPLPAPDPGDRFRNYVESVLGVLARDPGRTVLTDADGRQTTAGMFLDGVHRIAAELTDRGIGRGSTVSLLSGNRSEAITARYAANLLGARVAFLYEAIHTQLAPGLVAHFVRSVDTAILLVDPALRQTAEQLLARPGLPPVLFLGPSPLGVDLVACASRQDGRRAESAARPEDDCCIRLTGGSTGIPKGVCMTFDQYPGVLTERVELLRFRPPHLAEPDTPPCFLACGSLAHSAGTTADAALLAGGRVVLQRGFDPGEVLAAIERERITDVWMISPLLGKLLDHPGAGTTDVSSLRRVGYGGHLLSSARLRRAEEVFGPVLYGWYGQTEAGLIAEVKPHEHTRIGRTGQLTVGRAMPGVEIAVCDAAGERLPAGEVGEIRVRSAQVMSGYWQQPGLTADILCDGWIRTGDAGYLDDDGYLYLAGRYQEMIKIGAGHRVFPEELETLLLTHPAIGQCMVFGVRRPDDAEEVHAAIVPASGHTVDQGLIRDFVTTHKGHLYVPSALHLLPDMPVNAIGKTDRQQVRALLGLAGMSLTVD